MYNLLKYEWFRFKKNKCLILILLIAALWTCFQPITYKVMKTSFQEYGDEQAEGLSEADDEAVGEVLDEEEKEDSIGFTVMGSSKWYSKGFKPTVFDYYVSLITSMIPALLLVIFTILYVKQEFISGFVKSIGAYIKMSQLYLANMLMIALAVIMMNVVIIGVSALASVIVEGYLIWGSIGALLKYSLYVTLLSLAFLAIPVAIFYIVRTGTLAIVLGISEAMMGTLVCARVVNLLLREYLKVSDDFQLSDYFAVYHLKMSEFEFAKNAVEKPIIFAIIGIVVCSVASMYALKKKDV